MALAVTRPVVPAEPEVPEIPPRLPYRLRADARARGLSREQLEDLLDLWEEFYWFPPWSLHELDAELAR